MLRRVGKVVNEIWRYNVAGKLVVLKPKAVMVILTYRCNSRCTMCNIWKRKTSKELDFKEWKKVFSEKMMAEVETLTISGGEGILYPEYLKTVKMMIEKLPKLRRIILNTNGFLPIKIENYVEKIALMGKKKSIEVVVSVSLDGVGEEHDEIRGIKGGFKRVMETIDRLERLGNKYGVETWIAGVLMKRNLSKYWEFKDWMKSKGLNYSFQIVGFHENYIGNKDAEEKLDFKNNDKQELDKVLDDLKSDKRNFGLMGMYWEDVKQMYHGSRRHTPCPYLVDEMAIDSLGDVYYCLSAKPIGNILKDDKTVKEIYTDPKNVAWRKTMWSNECKKCNSGCDVMRAMVGEVKKIGWYKITGKLL